MIQRYKQEIILLIFCLVFVVSFYFLYGLILPFVIGLIAAFAVDPLIRRIKKKVKNRNAATSLFLAGCLLIFITILVLFTSFINRDFERLSKSYSVLKTENQDKLDTVGQRVVEYITSWYDVEETKEQLKQGADTIIQEIKDIDVSTLDTESIKSGYSEIVAFFSSNDETRQQTERFGLMFILFSSIAYFVLILFQLDYFKDVKDRYFNASLQNTLSGVYADFNKSFLRYFKLRSKIVLLLSVLYFVGFLIMDLPGSILFTLLIILLSFIPYLQYVMLIPLAISCLVVSTETGYSFIILYGIVMGIFIVASIIEELVLTPKIMEKNIGMNPVIMILALSIWGYVLGLPGLLLGVPITSLMIIYFKRLYPTLINKDNG